MKITAWRDVMSRQSAMSIKLRAAPKYLILRFASASRHENSVPQKRISHGSTGSSHDLGKRTRGQEDQIL